MRWHAAPPTGIGGNVSEDDIFTALAADLVDSVLDGRGAEGTVARYTAIAHVVSAQRC